jgi:transposase
MLDQATRMAILRLREEGHGTRAIAKMLGISRGAAMEVIRSGSAEVPRIERPELAEPHREEIMRLYAACKNNLVRVHEELHAQGVLLSYQALTAFCRRHGVGYEPKQPVGQYVFAPGQEMQHDTSPHVTVIGGRKAKVQTASLALCFSRMLFFQCYPHFRRFECKVFLTEALTHFEGACSTCMIDNTHVVVLSGSGRTMVPVPEMEAFGERFGFEFRAHEIGDANRSARVENPFNYIENNFFANRTFSDWNDLNAQARMWCDKVNAKEKRSLHASPRELFVSEHAAMNRLPAYVPEVYELHHRVVDTEGFVNVRRNRYSAPYQLIGRDVEIRESKDRIDVYDGPRRVASHLRVPESIDARIINPEHRPPRHEGFFVRQVPNEERRLTERIAETAAYIAVLRKRGRGTLRDLRVLLRMSDEYPRAAMVAALLEATHYGMADLDRLERMVLRRIARDFFSDRDTNKGPDDDR